MSFVKVFIWIHTKFRLIKIPCPPRTNLTYYTDSSSCKRPSCSSNQQKYKRNVNQEENQNDGVDKNASKSVIYVVSYFSGWLAKLTWNHFCWLHGRNILFFIFSTKQQEVNKTSSTWRLTVSNEIRFAILTLTLIPKTSTNQKLFL